MDQELLITLLFAAIISISAFVQCALGFGYAVVALSAFSYFVNIREANVVVSLSILAPLTFGVWSCRRDLNCSILLICLGGAAIGLPLGLFVFCKIDAGLLIRITGLLVFLLALDGLFSRRSDRSEKSPSLFWTTIAGASGGLLAGATGMGGPPVAAYALRQSWPAQQIKAFLFGFSLLLAMLRAVGLAATGWIDQTLLLYSLAAVLFAVAGGYVGLHVSRDIDTRKFRRLTMVALMLLSMGMIVRPPKDRPSLSEDVVSMSSRIISSSECASSTVASRRTKSPGHSANSTKGDS